MNYCKLAQQMMTKYIYIAFLALSLAACGSEKKEKIPAGILPKEKMIAVITDLHVAEAAINLNLLRPDSLYDVYEKNKITKQQYDSSFKYYSLNPEKLVEIYNEVLNEISKKQAEFAKYKGTYSPPLKQNFDTISGNTPPGGFKKLLKPTR